MKRIILLLIVAVCTLYNVTAAPVSVQTAEQVGQNFLSQIKRSTISNVNLVYYTESYPDFSDSQAVHAYYVFSAFPDGFVIVAGDDRCRPILGYSENGEKLLDNVSFIVNHDDKIAFVGSNEKATTMLFKILAGEEEPDEGEFKWGVTTSQAYFPKDNTKEFSNELNIVDWLTQFSEEKDATYVRGFLGRMLFRGEDGLKKVKVLSGGEKVRCLISKMMIMASNVLIFDDPTNHLDMESITALNNALIKFNGVEIFTSHDHQFIQTTANRIMEIVPGGKLIDKITTYDEYLENDEMARKRQGYSEENTEDED